MSIVILYETVENRSSVYLNYERHNYISVLKLSFFEITLLLFNYSCLHFIPLPPPQPNLPLSIASTLSIGFVHVSFRVVIENPSPHCSLPTLLWLLLDCS